MVPVRFVAGFRGAPLGALGAPSDPSAWYVTTSRVRWLRPGVGQVLVVVNPGHCYGASYQVERDGDGWHRASFEGVRSMLIC